ncbi:hypothetical protein K9N68_07505 [Kovacikia minuta CCNUW1]|uniref:hypothetical protein n=1 Tax=Kovacikia minuta TaxID=2931930 RepID=UPI001CCDADB8|nr:hypothetical protein [Kovacikia minuta]UBF27751.1 hypothetical protein K9N68_07505 [Kovacikia minuta CCNUW1]
MAISPREKISTDLKQVQEVGKLRSDRIREIIRQAVFEMQTEFQEGSVEFRAAIKDALFGSDRVASRK